jgi:hypothetical protein
MPRTQMKKRPPILPAHLPPTAAGIQTATAGRIKMIGAQRRRGSVLPPATAADLQAIRKALGSFLLGAEATVSALLARLYDCQKGSAAAPRHTAGGTNSQSVHGPGGNRRYRELAEAPSSSLFRQPHRPVCPSAPILVLRGGRTAPGTRASRARQLPALGCTPRSEGLTRRRRPSSPRSDPPIGVVRSAGTDTPQAEFPSPRPLR